MLAWGWRVPFLLSAILVIVGLVVRVQMEETPIFRLAQEQKKVVKSPLTEVFKKSWKQVLQATFLVAVTYTLFYTLATWSLAWGTKSTEQGGGSLGFANQEYLLMLMIAVCVFAAFIVISCVNADKFGRKRVIIISSCCLVAFALLFPYLLDPAVVGHSARSAHSCPNCSTPTCATPAPASATTWPPSSARHSYRPSPPGCRTTGACTPLACTSV